MFCDPPLYSLVTNLETFLVILFSADGTEEKNSGHVWLVGLFVCLLGWQAIVAPLASESNREL